MSARASSLVGKVPVVTALLALHHRFVRLPRAARIVDVLAELAGPADSLLDVGAGDGRVGAALAERLGARTARGVDVVPQPGASLETCAFDGARLPFDDRSFDLVLLSDVLHHAEHPEALFGEAVRVARRAVLVKDHLAFSSASRLLLHAMDLAGNLAQGVEVRASYLDGAALAALVEGRGASIDRIVWPLDVHDAPIRWVLPSRLHFAAKISPPGPEARPS